MCGAVSFLLFIVDGLQPRGQSIEHCVIALFSNYTYYIQKQKLKLCSGVNLYLASSRLCLPSGLQLTNGQGITNHSYNHYQKCVDTEINLPVY